MDVRAFEELVVRYQGIVCGVAYAVLRDRARSEEVAQEAFLLAWQRRAGTPGWICMVARNLARNVARRRCEDSLLDEPISTGRDVRDALIAHEEATRANTALARLPDPLREAVVVYYHGDESMAAVAAALDISHAAAKQRVHRGREQLREALDAVENQLRRARPGLAFTGACVAAYLARGETAAAATSASTATTSASTSASRSTAASASASPSSSLAISTPATPWAIGWIAVAAVAAFGGIAVAWTREASHLTARTAASAQPAVTRAVMPTRPAPPALPSSTGSFVPRPPFPDAVTRSRPTTLFGMTSPDAGLHLATSLIEVDLNMPIRFAEGYRPIVTLDIHDTPVLTALDGLLAQANAKRSEIAAVRILQSGGRTDAATLGGDRVTMQFTDESVLGVMQQLEPHLHMPIFRNAEPDQLPGPSAIDGELYIRTYGSADLELVPHVTLEVTNVTAGEALARVLEQAGLGYERTTGYFIEPR